MLTMTVNSKINTRKISRAKRFEVACNVVCVFLFACICMYILCTYIIIFAMHKALKHCSKEYKVRLLRVEDFFLRNQVKLSYA